MSIIEKLVEDLIIQTLSQTEWESGLNENYKQHAESIEQQRNELLEALIEIMDSIIGVDEEGIVIYTEDMDMCKIQSVIEKVCYPMKWEEIKELK